METGFTLKRATLGKNRSAPKVEDIMTRIIREREAPKMGTRKGDERHRAGQGGAMKQGQAMNTLK